MILKSLSFKLKKTVKRSQQKIILSKLKTKFLRICDDSLDNAKLFSAVFAKLNLISSTNLGPANSSIANTS